VSEGRLGTCAHACGVAGRGAARLRLLLARRNADSCVVLSRTLSLGVLTGLLAGDMVLIEVVLLPYWRCAPPADFRNWFAVHSGRIRNLIVPLGRQRNCRRSPWRGAFGITVTVNEPTNHQFTVGTLTATDTTGPQQVGALASRPSGPRSRRSGGRFSSPDRESPPGTTFPAARLIGHRAPSAGGREVELFRRSSGASSVPVSVALGPCIRWRS
jgi:hypothetical protein